MTTSPVVSVTDELIAELEQYSGVPSIAALLAERAELKRDAARYWKLRYGSGWPAVFADSNNPEPLRMVELDAAIDAAMQP